MKWVYVPIMFALAFIYTKFSFNDRESKQPMRNLFSSPARGPASVEEEKITNIELKRVPSPIIYKHLNDSSFMNAFLKVAEFKGTIIGNPHVESFGFVIDDRSKTTFGLRDFSDASEGKYLHDVLAHLVSVKTLEKKVTWINYFDAYKSGLQDQPHVFSYYVDKGLGDAVWISQRVFEDNVSNNSPFEFTQLKKTHSRVGTSRRNLIQDALKKKFPKIQFYDFFEDNSPRKNYQLLVRVRPQDKIQWLELSDSTLCDYDQTFKNEVEPISFEKRLSLIRTDIFEGKFNQTLDSTFIDKKDYILKFSDNFSAKLNLNDIPIDDYHDIFLDEAYVLGKIHRKSLGEKADDYIKAWATIPGSIVDEKMIELKYRLKDLQE